MRKGTIPDINALASLTLNIANLIDEQRQLNPFIEELGMGCAVASNRLRRGVSAIADIQEQLSRAKRMEEIAKIGEEEAYDFMEEIFGERHPHTLNEKYKNRIKELVKSINEEIENIEEEE